ncbi:MAG: hypothetical protein WKF66_13515 [Pedobacter sp.]
MKLILINCLIYFLTFNFRQEPLSQVALIKVPNKVQKINNAEAVLFIQKNFDKPRMNSRLKNMYKTGSIIIGFEDYERSSPMDLDELKERTLGNMEEIRAAGTNDEVDIINIKGKKFFIHKRHKSDEYLFNFISEPKNNKGLKGGVLFKKADSLKANEVLKTLLSNIVFK